MSASHKLSSSVEVIEKLLQIQKLVVLTSRAFQFTRLCETVVKIT